MMKQVAKMGGTWMSEVSEPSYDNTTRILCNHTSSFEIPPVSSQARLSESKAKTTSYYLDFLSFLCSPLLCLIVLRPVS